MQFLVYVDSIGSGSPMDMETDGPMLEDVNLLKKTVEEEATQVINVESVSDSRKCACLYEVGVVRTWLPCVKLLKLWFDQMLCNMHTNVFC